jgi:hypothetical protein
MQKDKLKEKVVTTVYDRDGNIELHIYESGKIDVCAFNEGGFNGTAVDLGEVLVWIKENRPDLYRRVLDYISPI